MSKTKRPGVQAGCNLVSLDDVESWAKVEQQGREVVASIPNLATYERSLEELGTAKECFTKSDLVDIVVLWKHTVGKNRIYNKKYLNANSDQQVQESTRSAISLAISINEDDCTEEDGSLSAAGRKAITEAIGEMTKLKGVGPATASAVLTLVRPDLFCYLYDEVIDVFEPTRDYKISNYLRVNSRCMEIAKTLGRGWTPSRVAKSIWIAARYLALNGEDLSQPQNENGQDNEDEGDEDGDDDEEDDGDADEDEGDDDEEGEPPSKKHRN